jgi:[citrate (pro-3S)-lyase] ligase
MVQLESKESKYINIADGHRITLGNPEHYDNTVYIFGNCNFFGAYNTDMDTCSSQLQRLLNDAVSGISKVWRVQNYGLFISNNLLYYPNFIYSIREKVKPGDVILYQSYSSEFSKLPHISFSRDIISPEYGILYHDKHHFSNNMHRYIADKFFKFLCENEFFEDASMDFGYKTLPIPVAGIQIEKRSAIGNVPLAELQPWLESIRKYRPRIGSIVMNCNPFTLGHRYLIEQSASTVEKLFIFVVEEDKSVFPFADRIELVRQGTADLPNVTVLPSGKFIISQLTFTDYFGKSEMQDKTVDPSMDVELFARHIAPALGITVRFAGEEPLDNVTRQYNEAMTRILPYHGVAFEVIPRKGEQGGGVISASKVRKLLEAKDFDEIEKIVPASTMEYLRRNVHK